MRGIGIDIVEVERIRKKCEKKAFRDLVFTPEEIHYCGKQGNPDECFAARFAAKEAYMKAMGLGWSSNSNFLEIEVFHLDSGQPNIRLSGPTLGHFSKKGYTSILLTLSHTSQTAVAVVLVN